MVKTFANRDEVNVIAGSTVICHPGSTRRKRLTQIDVVLTLVLGIILLCPSGMLAQERIGNATAGISIVPPADGTSRRCSR